MVEILQTDVPNKNNRVYPRMVVERAIEEFNQRGVNVGTLEDVVFPSAYVDIREAAFTVSNLRIDDNGMAIADIKYLATPKGKVLERLEPDNLIAYTFVGNGNLTAKDGVTTVTDFHISHVAAIPAHNKA